MYKASGGIDLTDREGSSTIGSSSAVLCSDDVRLEHQAPAATQFPLAPLRGSVCDYDPMKRRGSGIGQINWEGLGAGPVEEYSVWMRPNPPLSSPHLLRRMFNCPSIPSAPV